MAMYRASAASAARSGDRGHAAGQLGADSFIAALMYPMRAAVKHCA
jgi:hypothetical protein